MFDKPSNMKRTTKNADLDKNEDAATEKIQRLDSRNRKSKRRSNKKLRKEKAMKLMKEIDEMGKSGTVKPTNGRIRFNF